MVENQLLEAMAFFFWHNSGKIKNGWVIGSDILIGLINKSTVLQHPTHYIRQFLWIFFLKWHPSPNNLQLFAPWHRFINPAKFWFLFCKEKIFKISFCLSYSIPLWVCVQLPPVVHPEVGPGGVPVLFSVVHQVLLQVEAHVHWQVRPQRGPGVHHEAHHLPADLHATGKQTQLGFGWAISNTLYLYVPERNS